MKPGRAYARVLIIVLCGWWDYKCLLVLVFVYLYFLIFYNQHIFSLITNKTLLILKERVLIFENCRREVVLKGEDALWQFCFWSAYCQGLWWAGRVGVPSLGNKGAATPTDLHSPSRGVGSWKALSWMLSSGLMQQAHLLSLPRVAGGSRLDFSLLDNTLKAGPCPGCWARVL